MPVVLTENAAREIATIVKQQKLDPEQIRLRVGVKGGGCSGFSYLLDLTEVEKESDELWEYSFDVHHEVGGGAAGDEGKGNGNGEGNGDATPTGVLTVRVVCDPKSYLYLNGTTIDFKDEIMGRGFVFENPNATSTCGCGSSFSA